MQLETPSEYLRLYHLEPIERHGLYALSVGEEEIYVLLLLHVS
jgi:hypothetical protein